MSTLGNKSYDKGGMCYSACQEAFEWYTSSVYWCQKGCDFGVGRQSDDLERERANNMCKMLAANHYNLGDTEDLDNLADVRIHATMYSNNSTNLFKACLAGVRRQRY